MRLGIIGGVERSEQHYTRLAAAAGHEVLFHPGHMNGGGAAAIESFVARCDVVVIVTELNSHGAVQSARRILRARGKTPLLVRRFGLSRFAALLEAATDQQLLRAS
jgi:hypothetical protein